MVKHTIRPAIFKWRQTAPELILCAVRWYLRYSLSFRDVEELLAERGLAADHTTIWRWVQRYGPALEQRLRRHLKPTNRSWRVDETYIRVQGRWCYRIKARIAIFELSKDGITRIAVTRLSTTSHQSITNEPTAPNSTFRAATNSRLKNPRRRPRRREK